MAGTRAMGAKLEYQVSGAGGKKYIAHLTSLGAINVSNSDIDVTDHDSPNGNQEFIAGQASHDNLSFSGNIVKADTTFKEIYALANSRTVCSFIATYANGAKMAFSGFFTKVAMGEQSTDGLMGYEGEIKITGDITFTDAA